MGAECCKAVQKSSTSTLRFGNDLSTQQDDLLFEAQQLLLRYQAIHQSYFRCQEDIKELTGYPLNNISSFIKNLQIFLWSLSAFFNGEISHSGLLITTFPPFLSLDSFPVSNLIQRFFECLCVYLDIISVESKTIKQAIQELHDLNSQIDDEKKLRKANNDKSSEDNDYEGVFMKSYRKATNELKETEKTMEALLEASAKVPWLIIKAQELYNKADLVGIQAYRKEIRKPKEIAIRFEHFLEEENSRPILFRTTTGKGEENTPPRARNSVLARTSIRMTRIPNQREVRSSIIQNQTSLKFDAPITRTSSIIVMNRKQSSTANIMENSVSKAASTEKKEKDDESGRSFIIVNNIKGSRDIKGTSSFDAQKRNSSIALWDHRQSELKRSPFLADQTTNISIGLSDIGTTGKLKPLSPNSKLREFTLNKMQDTSYCENVSDEEELLNCSIQSIKDNCFDQTKKQRYSRLEKVFFN